MPIQREPAIDVLRGLALLGILLVHTSVFAMPALHAEYSRVMFPAAHDRIADFLISWLIQGKFYPMFAFLFGWGAFVMASRAGDFSRLYRRRLLALLLVGLVHALLLFEGDILVTYALLGFFVRRAINRAWPVEKLVRRARLLILIGALLLVAITGTATYLAGADAYPPDKLAELARQVREGGFLELLKYRVLFLGAVILLLVVQAPHILGMFYLGLAAARAFAVGGLEGARPLARRLLPWTLWPGLIGGGAASALSSFPLSLPGWVPLIADAVGMGVFGPLLAIGWLSLATLWLAGGAPQALARTVGAAGRMSLSGYVGQSLVMGFIYQGYGLGLFGTVGPARAALIAVATWAGLVAFSMAWLGTFRVGPLEWLIRPGVRPPPEGGMPQSA
jgi:uncharacterized protein